MFVIGEAIHSYNGFKNLVCQTNFNIYALNWYQHSVFALIQHCMTLEEEIEHLKGHTL